MIPLEATLLIFFAMGLMRKSKTFYVLALFAWFNIYIYPKTTADDLYLMLTYTTVDFFAALVVLHFGDIQKFYQTSLLALMILAHLIMEAALIQDWVGFIESGVYIHTITALLILQMLGGFYGTDRIFNPLRCSDFDIWATDNFGVSNHKARNFINEDKQ